MKDKEFEAWKVQRAKGKVRFFFLNGVLAFGIPTFVAVLFIIKPFAEGFSSAAAISYYVVWPIAGFLFGVLMWHISEHKYRKELAKRSDT
jgi:Na+/melibiose symporter-like transporter